MQRRSSLIKKQQRESLFFRELSVSLHDLFLDESSFASLYLTRVELSNGNGACILFFGCLEGQEGFDRLLQTLKLYKPSVRKLIATLWQSHHTPEVVFRFDDSMQKVDRMNQVFETLSHQKNSEI